MLPRSNTDDICSYKDTRGCVVDVVCRLCLILIPGADLSMVDVCNLEGLRPAEMMGGGCWREAQLPGKRFIESCYALGIPINTVTGSLVVELLLRVWEVLGSIVIFDQSNHRFQFDNGSSLV